MHVFLRWIGRRCIWDLSIAWRFQGCGQSQRIILHETNFPIFQLDVAINTKRVKDCETRLRDDGFVWNSKHANYHAKFDAVDPLTEWIKENSRGLSFLYDLTSCDLQGAPIPKC